ncbi:FimV/HubP family polar landmark protein [Noviherbaspirillum galbum]|uniref:LysM peptidoglycan-binding domain-containing protein n=1 Tax=Noviherbaspirillum galbum TaxID=2709383 RepID=A0A6B3SME8_9BURK|nr:FimV/HubP family polar landmark protein [Noviherbaspirillum galbum]NEX61628.1 LysM peptidoglycan-binding domain-containing protein [Noviherbaspirillum galbum]
MPSNTQNKRFPAGTFNLKTVSAAVVSALLFSNAGAVGLGKLTVLSALGQPLRAEIELTTVAKDESGALVAKLASPDAFRQAGIDYNNALTSLRFAVEQRGDRQVVRVTSPQPLNEPFVDMLLELAGPNGRLVREYTFLLDPADLRTAQPAQVAPSAPAAESANVPRASQPANAAPASMPSAMSSRADGQRAAPSIRAPRADAGPADAAGGEYRVRSGDSLARIAGQYRSPGVSLDQMLVAMFRNNPDAFAGNNMNRLKAGQILSVPSAETARGISAGEAHEIVVAQSADFGNYRNKLAGQVATSDASRSAESRQSASGKITAKVEEKPTPASESKDKLKLSNAAPAAGAGSAAPVAAEDKIAREKAVADANARVKELEKNVNDLQKLLDVKSKTLADQQKQAEAKPAAKPEQKPEQKAEQKPAEQAASAPAASAPAMPATPAVTASEKPAEPKPTKPAAPTPAPAPSFTDELLASPFLLPGLGALLVALGGLGLYSRRKKQAKSFDDSIITDSSLKANSLFGSTGGQSVDTNNSVFNSSFSPSSSQLDSNEVDPVAEADVYIAYGRDAQAEEILKEALRTQPDRHAVRVKLLEIYSNRRDLRAFEVLATELYGMTKGEGPEWTQAATMGAAIDPNNPLYAGGKSADAPATSAADADHAEDKTEPTQPLDEQGLSTLLSTTQIAGSDSNLGNLDQDTAYFNDTALNTAPPETEKKEPAPPVNAFDSLDFDLEGMDSLEQPTLPKAEAPSATPVPDAPDLSSIDFNFLDEPAKDAPASSADADLKLDETQPLISDIDLGLPTEPAREEVSSFDDLQLDPPPSLPNDAPLELAAAEAAPLEMDIPELPSMDAAPASHSAKDDALADPLDFDLSGISLELDPQSEAAAPSASHDAADHMKAADLSGFDLPAEPESLDLPADSLSLDEGLPSLDDSNTTSVDAEMATKLDLAIAYQEIGDKEGARELLDEVLKGGTPEQSEKARSLLLELA